MDDFLNKYQIKDKAPSVYMREFVKRNEAIDEAMKSHLIGDLDAFGVWADDYDKFFEKRLEAFSKELKKRIITTEKDVLNKAETETDEN